jgi:S-DNA-T family DNA segregation ATPase FtsK/SpoIIIE
MTLGGEAAGEDMSRKKNRKTLEAAATTPADRRAVYSLAYEVGLTFVLVVGLFMAISLLSYRGLDGDGLPLKGSWTGPAGTYLAFALYQIVGHASHLVPLMLIIGSVVSLARKANAFGPLRVLGAMGCFVMSAALMDVGWAGETVLGGHGAGGAAGLLFGAKMISLFAAPGSFLLLTAGLCISAVLISGIGPRVFSRVLAELIWTGLKRGWALVVRLARSTAQLASRLTAGASHASGYIGAADGSRAPVADEPLDEDEPEGDEEIGEQDELDEDVEEAADGAPTIHHHMCSAGDASRVKEGLVSRTNEPKSRGEWRLPDPSMLTKPEQSENEVSAEDLQVMAEKLTETLGNYGIKGQVTDIHPGPVVTTLEMRPSKGTKVSTISRLGDDLAMSLEVTKVRIVAPIPGKNAVGFELPSPNRQRVLLGEIMGDPRFSLSKSRIPLAVGKDIIGNSFVMDLSKMPHLLIAGTTGSGKSVAINTLLTSLLMNFTPDDLRLILVDPKMVELQPYDGIPHLYLPVVTDMKHAASALRWAVDEMERRYQLFSDLNVRDIRGFNRKVEKYAEKRAELLAADEAGEGAKGQEQPSDDPAPEHLPYVVIVIDEFADLMMTSARDVEMAVSRLAAKARAAGIHLIVATQRPSVNVVTGLIKSNFPCRIAFKVASKVDSRIMLDTNGAECLLGMGDMLILPPGQSDLLRMHGAFISDEEITQIADMWRQQANPTYCEEILKAGDDEDGLLAAEDEELDPRHSDAVAIAVNEGKVSISYLQRKLKIGYNRAARIVEKMESDGIVGPSIPGRSHREVLIPPATG